MKEKTIQIKDGSAPRHSAPASGLQFISDMNSDIGTCRLVNQDACCVRMMKIDGYSLVLAAVCDGVGGMQEGGYASKSTIQFLNNWFDYTVSKNIRGKNQEQLMKYLHDEIEQCIQKQNRLLYEYAQDKGIRTGTTLTLLVIINESYITAQIGDSRAYRINHELQQLTEDQSVVAREIRAGRLSPREAKYDKRRNIILQCVGASENLQIAFGSGNVGREDVFMLCSDGFVHELEDNEIKKILSPALLVNRSSIKKCIADAVSLVKERGERDNITVVLVKASGL
ncbi:MAG: serine/threonine-protein phosphatase [Lachnospiraceae bacterium]|nr:serine/threonine-protein phosphatase [Lachnospiraceae bacterium]